LHRQLQYVTVKKCHKSRTNFVGLTQKNDAVPRQNHKMNILILGGTQFLGLHLLTHLTARGHAVTLFNRGRRALPAALNAEILTGDRNQPGDLQRAAQGRQWDAVIDTCGYLPATVAESAQVLAGSVARYVFISSLSAYADFTARGSNESAPLGQLTAEQAQTVAALKPTDLLSGANFGELYGPLKALCEQAAEAAMPGRVLCLRPGLIVGRHDPTDRFTYWVKRLAQGGEVLAPGRPERPIQFIDAHDLAAWTSQLVEKRTVGTFNANGQAGSITMGDLLHTCQSVAAAAGKPEATPRWVAEDFLAQHDVAPWSELPLWIPESSTEMAGFMQIDCAKAFADGLQTRPLQDTVRDVLTWLDTQRGDAPAKAGLGQDKELSLLRQWQAQASTLFDS
jgi:2'-hydroxyisoflavone reductase